VANDSLGRLSGASKIPDRRIYERRPVRFAYLDTGNNHGGAILDISEGGLAVQSVLRFHKRSFSKIRFRLSASEHWVETSGRLIWMNKSQKVAGIAFSGISGEARNRIKDWSKSSANIEALNNAPSGMEPFFETCRVAGGVTVPETPIFQPRNWNQGYISSLRSWLVGLLTKTALLTMALVLIEPHSVHLVPQPNRGSSSTSADIKSDPLPEWPVRVNASTKAVSALAQAEPTFKEPISGSLMLQVAAMRRQANAEALSSTLREKGFPVVLFQSEFTHFFVVAAGPFANLTSRNAAQTTLNEQGFRPFALRWPQH
jgi:cell division septation protein DedD